MAQTFLSDTESLDKDERDGASGGSESPEEETVLSEKPNSVQPSTPTFVQRTAVIG